MDSDVVVIGAGLSGLSAAKWLSESNVKVILLEARDRVGGRTLTKRDPKVNYVDIGGAYVGPTQNHLLRMAKEFGVETYKVNEVEDLLHYKNGRRKRFRATEMPVFRNPFVNMDLNNIFYLMDKMGEEIPEDGPWLAPHAEEWDTMTFGDFLKQNCWTQATIDFFKNFINIIITSEPYEASLLSFLWYIKQCGGTRRTFSTTNGGQERKFKGGSQQISEKMAAKLGSDIVIMNSPVVSINQESKDVVVVKTLNGKDYKTKYVILAIPPILQMKIHFTPDLPALRNQLNQRQPIGSVMKTILYYNSTFWRDHGLCGSLLVEGGEEHPMFLTLDDTKPDGTHPAIIGFILADKCRKLHLLSPEERRNLLAKSLAQATGLKEFLKPIHYEEKNWMEEQYSGGCYTAMCPPGFLTRYGRILRTPIDRLHFAGTETATLWSGYMDGAIQAGERAAREVLHNMGLITADRIWQTEPQSQDVVPQPFHVTFSERYTPSIPRFLKFVSFSTVIGAATVLFLRCPRLMKNLKV
ncbi:amine oxidase [flavin-containing]-like [Uloborus diversus]|uniref:amine oxidase [flavin-containing]-like n=1 Tax=Uloborus diversus TaxID=327109 RepID=UPI002409C08F|nr:amine oxidase [flavin-containing]-like [Uloborus diversus]